MKSKLKLILFILITGIMIISCKKNVEDEKAIENTSEIKEIEKQPIIEEKVGIPSPLSGIYAEEEKVNRVPVAVMFDNHPRARWQAGLKDAEIVYEFLVEFPYTRYMGIYLINEPESIGPIRSARPYFITTSLEYKAVYVHVGGSSQAKKDIRNLKIKDIDDMSSARGVFWRKSHKKAPNNMYSSMEVLRKTAIDKKYALDKYTSFKIREDDKDIEGGLDVLNVVINYRKDNTSEYNYDALEKIYIRKKDGELHIDESDGTPIVAKNIIIQNVKTRVLDNEGRLELDLVGSGSGKYISNGRYIDINWLKSSKEGKTLYYNLDNNEIILNPGVTWIQIVKDDTEIILE